MGHQMYYYYYCQNQKWQKNLDYVRTHMTPFFIIKKMMRSFERRTKTMTTAGRMWCLESFSESISHIAPIHASNWYSIPILTFNDAATRLVGMMIDDDDIAARRFHNSNVSHQQKIIIGKEKKSIIVIQQFSKKNITTVTRFLFLNQLIVIINKANTRYHTFNLRHHLSCNSTWCIVGAITMIIVTTKQPQSNPTRWTTIILWQPSSQKQLQGKTTNKRGNTATTHQKMIGTAY